MSRGRISVTLPPDLIAAADRRAAELDRSRSWVVAEALREHLSARTGGRVSEPAAAYLAAPVVDAAAEVAAARRSHLAAELALQPAERLRRAEELGRLAREAQRRSPRYQGIAFETYDDYYAWKAARRIGR